VCGRLPSAVVTVSSPAAGTVVVSVSGPRPCFRREAASRSTRSTSAIVCLLGTFGLGVVVVGAVDVGVGPVVVGTGVLTVGTVAVGGEPPVVVVVGNVTGAVGGPVQVVVTIAERAPAEPALTATGHTVPGPELASPPGTIVSATTSTAIGTANSAARGNQAFIRISRSSCEDKYLDRRRSKRRIWMSQQTLTVTDNRTGRSFEVPIADQPTDYAAIRAADLTTPFATDQGPGLVLYDPGFLHTAASFSRITNIHLTQGVLEHRGYRIEALAEHSTFIEVAYLLIYGELPTPDQLEHWKHEISTRKFVHENLKGFIKGFRYDAHPMAMLAASVGALGSFYLDAGDIDDEAAREAQILRLLAKLPTLAAYAYRHGDGKPFVYPSDDLSYPGNLLSMMFKMSEIHYKVDPAAERALDTLLIVHADHEQSAATAAVRAVGSSHTDPYAAVAAGLYAMSGPVRGVADQATLEMLRQIGSVEAVPAYLESVKSGDDRLMGFGHPLYRSPDPRAAILRRRLDELADGRALSPLVAVADALRERAAEDEYFVSRGIYPNAGLYSGLLYEALRIPDDMFVLMLAVARTAGFIAQWLESVLDPEQETVRPRQLYVGSATREYVALSDRN
jgi:citrate synthase